VIKKKLFQAIGAITLILGASSCEQVECCTAPYYSGTVKVCDDGNFTYRNGSYVYTYYNSYYITYWGYYKNILLSMGGSCETETK
jgi:hypothetical protein